MRSGRTGRAYSVAAAPTALLTESGIRADWTSRQRQPVSERASTDPVEWAHRLFQDPPARVAAVLALRDRAVALVGLRPTSPSTFDVLQRTEREALVGMDDRHLDFRASVVCHPHGVDVTTFVQIHNRLGRLYLLPVRVLHSLVVRRMLGRAAAHLDPRSTA